MHENFNIFENNIISVELDMTLWFFFFLKKKEKKVWFHLHTQN
jgi:hypothetical protein